MKKKTQGSSRASARFAAKLADVSGKWLPEAGCLLLGNFPELKAQCPS
jgi:hypothetical protein